MMSQQTPTREVGSEEMGENEEPKVGCKEWTPIIVKKDEIILAQKGWRMTFVLGIRLYQWIIRMWFCKQPSLR